MHSTKFSCENCDYKTISENYLKIHNIYVHTGDNLKKEPAEDGIDEELEKLLQDDDEKEADQNEMEADEPTGLVNRNHQNDLKNINSNQCPGCDKTFAYTCRTIAHFKSVHLKERFPCELCSSKFASIYMLRSHMKSKH